MLQPHKRAVFLDTSSFDFNSLKLNLAEEILPGIFMYRVADSRYTNTPDIFFSDKTGRGVAYKNGVPVLYKQPLVAKHKQSSVSWLKDLKLALGTQQAYRLQDRGISAALVPNDAAKRFLEKRGWVCDLEISSRSYVPLERALEARVRSRIRNGEFFALPKDFPTEYGTGAHLSTLDDTLIAYYPTDRHRRDRIAQRIKPGKYLKKYFPNMTDDEIRVAANTVTAGAAQLKFYSHAEDMIKAYVGLAKSGVVESCMAKELHTQAWKMHPLWAYHESDVELATLEHNGQVVARALYNKHNKHYPMVYGQWEKMKYMLDKAGFVHGPLDGAIINRIHINKKQIVCPYIDHKRALRREGAASTFVEVHDTHLRIMHESPSHSPVHRASNYSGGFIELNISPTKCSCCGAAIDAGSPYVYRLPPQLHPSPTIDDTIFCALCWDTHSIEVIHSYGDRYRTIPEWVEMQPDVEVDDWMRGGCMIFPILTDEPRLHPAKYTTRSGADTYSLVITEHLDGKMVATNRENTVYDIDTGNFYTKERLIEILNEELNTFWPSFSAKMDTVRRIGACTTNDLDRNFKWDLEKNVMVDGKVTSSTSPRYIMPSRIKDYYFERPKLFSPQHWKEALNFWERTLISLKSNKQPKQATPTFQTAVGVMEDALRAMPVMPSTGQLSMQTPTTTATTTAPYITTGPSAWIPIYPTTDVPF